MRALSVRMGTTGMWTGVWGLVCRTLHWSLCRCHERCVDAVRRGTVRTMEARPTLQTEEEGFEGAESMQPCESLSLLGPRCFVL